MVNIKVAVRIRPFSQREVNQKDESIVQTYEKSVLVTNLKVPEVPNGDSRQRIRRFAVDYCYDPKYPETCTQESVYQDIGKEVLDSMFDGYNACVLAYGHSASGKTYTMMGDEDDPGLTPRICQGLFHRMNEKAVTARVRFHTVISFLEIYNERVRDLLINDESGATAGSNFSLRVREHPKLGPYVQDLSQHIVNDEEQILEYLAIGNSRRSTAATENNIHSSRSHAVFTIRFKQTEELNYHSELSSKVHLVDLAGSERAGSTQSKTRLKEGANINKSLVTLGNVISALAESCETFINPKEQPVTKTWQPFVPYRDSVLTWLLKDTLGGNSNTIMVATVSPASSCLNETINTLRYAKRTKRIVNQPIINEDPRIRTIRELKEEIEKLRNVIVTLQTNNRNCLEDEISNPAKEEDIEGNSAPEELKETIEDASGTNCEENNGVIKDINNDEISSFGVLPHVSAPNEENNTETNNPNNRIGIRTASANSFNVDVSKINDENKTDVNGSVTDKLVHESQVYADSIGTFSRTKTTNNGNFCEIDGVYFRRDSCNFSAFTESKPRKRRQNPYKTYKDNQLVPKISRNSKLRLSSRKQARHRLRLNLRREYNSLENLTLPKMLHRSRPDLIKGIASHSKDGLPSTSSQSFTDVSGLSQSASENSLNSSGSVDSQTSENKSVKNWPEKSQSMEEKKKNSNRVKLSETMQKPISRQSSIGDGSGSSTPMQGHKFLPRRRGDKRSEIVAAVTTRLYATKKKPDPRMEALQATEKDDDDDGELEELKLCKRARMKLFDLSRKLAMAKRIKKTTDSDTQTDFVSGTVRVKEKCVVTDQSGIVQQQNSSTNTPIDRPLRKDKEQPIIMNQVFIPRFSNYVVECGKNVRVEVPESKAVKYSSGTQTFTLCKDQTTSPPVESPSGENFSDDSLEDDESGKWKRNCEVDSLEICAGPKTNKSGSKSQSNENVSKLSFTKPLEPVSFDYRRSYDSLVDSGLERTIDRSWLPITRYPIAGTNSLYEYDPNKSNPDVVYSNVGNESKPNKENRYQHKPKFTEEPPGSKIRKTEIVFPLYNGLPLAICTETVSSGENIAEDTLSFITSHMNRFLQNEENESSENSFASNDGSDITSSSETSSEDFVFYEGPKEKESLNRQSGLGNLYTISENSELSDITTSDPSSPQSSLQVLEQKKESKKLQSLGTLRSNQSESGRIHEENELKDGVKKEYTVHILRNPLLSSDLDVQERVYTSTSGETNGYKSPSKSESSGSKCTSSENDRLNSCSTLQFDITTEKPNCSSRTEPEEWNLTGKTVTNSPESSKVSQNSGLLKNDDAVHKSEDNKKQDKKSTEKVKKINWSDVQASTQRQFLNFNILGSSKQTPFSIDSNMFGEKKQTSEVKFSSEDSITFVFMGPSRQKTSMLMEIIKRTLGQCSSSDQSFSDKSHKKSKNRGVQCKLMRSVSVDTAMIALSRFAKHQRPVIDIARTSSLDNLVPEEMQTILEQGRLHGIREKGCQCDFTSSECQCRKSNVIKYTIFTSTTRDQGTETEKVLDMTDKCSMTSSMIDASCDALEDSEENLFDEYFPPLPRTALNMNECQNSESHWKNMKQVILGTSDYLRTEENPDRVRKSKKFVSWSDLSDYEDVAEDKSDENMTCHFGENELVTTKKLFCPNKTSQNEEYIKMDCVNSADQSPILDPSHTRRVRFTEPQRSCSEDMCNLLHEQREAVQTATNVTAFLKEAVQLLKNLNHLSQIYDLSTADKAKTQSDESLCEKVQPSLKKVETSVQTEATIHGVREIALSAESSPIRRARTSSMLVESRDRKGLNLTWPRQRPTSSRNVILGKPPTGLKSNTVLKQSRSPIFRTPSSQLSYDVIKNDIETSSTSTNWNISNLSTTFSNSYFGDSCSRPSSSKSFYSERGDGSSKYWRGSKIASPRLPKLATDLEADLEDSCRRLEIAVERDKLREENSSLKLTSLKTKKYIPSNWYYTKSFENDIPENRTDKEGSLSYKSNGKISPVENTVFRRGRTLEGKVNFSKRKPCKCYCHYRNNKVYRSSLELEAQPSFERHCHICCTPCDADESEMSSSTPALNSVCEGNKCRLLYYGYCPCSPVKLQHVKSSPRAYMLHLLSLRRQIVKNTYDPANNI